MRRDLRGSGQSHWDSGCQRKRLRGTGNKGPSTRSRGTGRQDGPNHHGERYSGQEGRYTGYLCDRCQMILSLPVARGELKAGLTDTDDVNVALEDQRPVAMVLPDRDGIGVPVMPNMVSLI